MLEMTPPPTTTMLVFTSLFHYSSAYTSSLHSKLCKSPPDANLSVIKWQIVQRGRWAVITRGHEEQSRTAGGQETSSMLWWATRRRRRGNKCSDCACERSSLWDATHMTPGMKRCWKEWAHSWDKPAGFLCSKPSCVYVSCLGYNS